MKDNMQRLSDMDRVDYILSMLNVRGQVGSYFDWKKKLDVPSGFKQIIYVLHDGQTESLHGIVYQGQDGVQWSSLLFLWLDVALNHFEATGSWFADGEWFLPWKVSSTAKDALKKRESSMAGPSFVGGGQGDPIHISDDESEAEKTACKRPRGTELPATQDGIRAKQILKELEDIVADGEKKEAQIASLVQERRKLEAELNEVKDAVKTAQEAREKAEKDKDAFQHAASRMMNERDALGEQLSAAQMENNRNAAMAMDAMREKREALEAANKAADAAKETLTRAATCFICLGDDEFRATICSEGHNVCMTCLPNFLSAGTSAGSCCKEMDQERIKKAMGAANNMWTMYLAVHFFPRRFYDALPPFRFHCL